MSWKLIFQLSMFGLAMGIGTVFFIPSSAEPILWPAIFIFCAVIIAKRWVKAPFLHGLIVGLVNSVWVTGAHLLFFDTYVAGHARVAELMQGTLLPPPLLMARIGLIGGLLSGVILGLFALAASKLLRRAPQT
jgi:hypothetical protein